MLKTTEFVKCNPRVNMLPILPKQTDSLVFFVNSNNFIVPYAHVYLFN